MLGTDSAPELTSSFNEEADIFSQKNVELHEHTDPSIVIIPNPTLKPIVVDDTRFDLQEELKSVQDDEYSSDSLADFVM